MGLERGSLSLVSEDKSVHSLNLRVKHAYVLNG